MKVLVDVSAGRVVADTIAGLGFDTVSVRDCDPTLPDIDILRWAVTEQRIVVTMDKDFGELVYRSGQPHCGIVLLRLEAARRAEKIAAVNAIFQNHTAALPGRFAVYQNGRLRIKS